MYMYRHMCMRICVCVHVVVHICLRCTYVYTHTDSLSLFIFPNMRCILLTACLRPPSPLIAALSHGVWWSGDVSVECCV